MGYQENFRRQHRPPDVRVLFIGESPPAKNSTFFYLGNSNLWKYTYEAFRNVYGTDLVHGNGFCEFFMSRGCYLEDLCLDPVNRMEKSERRRICEASVESLAKRISPFSPGAVVCVKKSIVRQVEMAMAKAELQAVPLHKLSFPSCGHQQEYVEGLAKLIKKLRASGVIV